MTRKKKALFACAALIMALALLEGVLRLHDFGFYFNYSADLIGMPLLDLYSIRRVQNRTVEFDRRVFWRFKPDQTLDIEGVYKEPVHINSHGFRGPDWPDRKSDGVLRVACLGDSTTFGWSVGEKDPYPYRLEKLLAEECGKEVEVLNLGVTGYTSLQGIELLKTKVKEWKPDLLVFAFGPNDRLPALMSDEEHLEKGTWDKSAISLTLGRLQVYKLIKSLAVYVKRRTQGISLDPATYIPRLKRKVSRDDFKQNVKKAKSLADSISADMIFIHVDYPSLPKDHPGRQMKEQAQKHGVSPPEWREWNGRKLVRHFRDRPGIRAFDLRHLFSSSLEKIKSGELDPQRAARLREKMPGKIKEEPWRYLMVDNGHPNEWGHEIIAEKILEEARHMDRFREICKKGKQE
ncbi:MAG: SGNH/GDSL hydrolase family protein [bacterium]